MSKKTENRKDIFQLDTMGKRLRYIRKEFLDMRQADLANVMGVDTRTISNWERDIGFNLSNVDDLLKELPKHQVYNIRREWFINGVGEVTELDQIRKYHSHPVDIRVLNFESSLYRERQFSHCGDITINDVSYALINIDGKYYRCSLDLYEFFYRNISDAILHLKGCSAPVKKNELENPRTIFYGDLENLKKSASND